MLQLFILVCFSIAIVIPLQIPRSAVSVDGFCDKGHSTALRGFAITGILLCHAAALLCPVEIARLLTPVGGIGVSIFLILSGYGLSESFRSGGLRDFWKKRFWGVYLPYIFIVILTLATRLHLAPGPLVLDLLAIEPVAEYYWYISYISVWYFLFYMILRFAPVKWQSGLFLSCAVLLFLVLPELQAEQSLSFIAGVFLSRFRNNILRRVGLWQSIGLLLLGIALLVVKQIPVVRLLPTPAFKLLQLGIKLSIASALILLTWYGRRLLPMVAFIRIGNYSYEIYLIHAYTIGILTWNLTKPALSGLFLVVTAVASVAFAHLLRVLKKKLVPAK